MSARVYLVRHAAHDNVGGYLAGRTPGIALGEAGRAQARRLAQRLKRERIDIIHASPVQRTRETAQAIADVAQREVEIAPALEEIDFGAWSGRTFEDLNGDEHWRRWNAARSITATPAGETMLGLQQRVYAHLLTTVRDHPESQIVMVSHADPIRAALAVVLGVSLDRLPSFDIAPASISIIDFDPWGATVRLVNEQTPDEEPA
ncbi:MAG: phosphoglycerate mutase protein [Hyphomicrobiales bacterium]|nr:phosphoglycerate mutase protein [Hyphomicrobiales bacterium]